MIAAASEGQLTKEIAKSFSVCLRTVESRLGKAAEALGASNSPHVVALAVRTGLIAARPWARLSVLNDRELEVVQALSEGQTVATIAERLALSRPTIYARIRNAKAKTQARTRCELAALFASRQLEHERLGFKDHLSQARGGHRHPGIPLGRLATLHGGPALL